MQAPDPRVKRDIEQAVRMLSGQCHHTETFKNKGDCVTCITDAAYTAVLTFVSRETSNALYR